MFINKPATVFKTQPTLVNLLISLKVRVIRGRPDILRFTFKFKTTSELATNISKESLTFSRDSEPTGLPQKEKC